MTLSIEWNRRARARRGLTCAFEASRIETRTQPTGRGNRMPASVEELLRKPIKDLILRFLDQRRPVPRGLLQGLECDPRRAARLLGKRLRERRRENRAEGQRLHRLLKYEIELWNEGYELVAGVDEAGMAPLAGPVVAA